MSRVFRYVHITQCEANLNWAMMRECRAFSWRSLFIYRILSNFWKYIHVGGKIILIMLFTLILFRGFLMSDTNELLDIAINETENLNKREVFLVRDLLKGYELNKVSRSQCLMLGTLFLNYVNTLKDFIQAIEKTSSGNRSIKLMSNNLF